MVTEAHTRTDLLTRPHALTLLLTYLHAHMLVNSHLFTLLHPCTEADTLSSFTYMLTHSHTYSSSHS